MEITKIAERQIKQNEASEVMDFTANNTIIRDLLTTIEQMEQFNSKANTEIKRLKDALFPAYVEPATDGRDLVMTEPVREYVFALRATRKRLTDMVGAAYTAGWMAGYSTGGTLDDESKTNLDWHCGEDWVEDGLRPELLKIIESV